MGYLDGLYMAAIIVLLGLLWAWWTLQVHDRDQARAELERRRQKFIDAHAEREYVRKLREQDGATVYDDEQVAA